MVIFFRVRHRRKTMSFVQNSEFWGFPYCYSILTFANEDVLTLKSLEEYAELNSLSKGDIFEVGQITKTKGFVKNTELQGVST